MFVTYWDSIRVIRRVSQLSLQWRHNGQDGVSNHQLHNCLLNRLLEHRSKKTSKLRVTGLCAENSSVTGDCPHKWPVTRKMFPYDDVIMYFCIVISLLLDYWCSFVNVFVIHSFLFVKHSGLFSWNPGVLMFVCVSFILVGIDSCQFVPRSWCVLPAIKYEHFTNIYEHHDCAWITTRTPWEQCRNN